MVVAPDGQSLGPATVKVKVNGSLSWLPSIALKRLEMVTA
jgi:hypothetical protein